MGKIKEKEKWTTNILIVIYMRIIGNYKCKKCRNKSNTSLIFYENSTKNKAKNRDYHHIQTDILVLIY